MRDFSFHLEWLRMVLVILIPKDFYTSDNSLITTQPSSTVYTLVANFRPENITGMW